MTIATATVKADSKCQDCPIRHRAVRARCETDELAQLEAIKYYRTDEAGQPITWAGDAMTFVASVVRGVAKLSQTLEDGRTQMQGLLLPSDFIGRPGRSVTSFNVTAVCDVTLCWFRRKQFESLMTRLPPVSERRLDMMLDALDAARELRLIPGRKTACERIASLLTIIARREATAGRFGIKGPIAIDLPLTRAALADCLGLMLETVSHQMSALQNDGNIVLHGKRRVQMPDFRRLMMETGDDADGGVVS